MQTIIVIVILGLSVAYALWRTRKALTGTGDPCDGCNGCALKESKRKNTEKACCNCKKVH